MPIPISGPSTPTPTTDPQQPTSPEDVFAALQRVVLFFILRELPESAQRELRIRWNSDTPEVAAEAAAVIAAVPEAFQHLPVTPEALQKAITAATQDAEIKEAIDKLQGFATPRLSASRGHLFDITQQAVAAIQTAKDSSLLAPSVRARVTLASGDLDSRIKSRREGIAATKRDRFSLRQDGDERVAEVEEKLASTEAELAVSLGDRTAAGRLTAATPTAARTGRKARPRRRSPR